MIDQVRVRVKGGGVTSKEIDRTWMCDSMETRDSAHGSVLGLERPEGQCSVWSMVHRWLESHPDVAEEAGPWCTGSLPFQPLVLLNPCLCMDTWSHGQSWYLKWVRVRLRLRVRCFIVTRRNTVRVRATAMHRVKISVGFGISCLGQCHMHSRP